MNQPIGSHVSAVVLPSAAPHSVPDVTHLTRLAHAAHDVDGDATRAIDLAREIGASVARPGGGDTRQLFESLATLAAADLTAARVVEAHLDALSILDQNAACAADTAPTTGSHERSWGVFAAEGRGLRLSATRSATGWTLSGTKPWCSLAGMLSHALVTAHTSTSSRRLFAVALQQPGVRVREVAWVARGLTAVPSVPVDFHEVAADPIGASDWYLERPGFAWGGIGVAACWWGGAIGVARQVFLASREREPDQLALAHLGALDVSLASAGVALAAAAHTIDAGLADGPAGRLLAARVRGIVARTVDDVIGRAGHALGPAPLALDERHTRRVADLQLYVRQHHAERDDASLGSVLASGDGVPW